MAAVIEQIAPHHAKAQALLAAASDELAALFPRRAGIPWPGKPLRRT